MSENEQDLTSPGTIPDDSEKEHERAEQAAVREAESRGSTETKFEEARREQEAARDEIAEDLKQTPSE